MLSKGSGNLKKKIIILLCIIIGIVILISLIDAIRYPISLKIKSNDVATAKIIFFRHPSSTNKIY